MTTKSIAPTNLATILLDASQAQVAAALGVSPQKVQRWVARLPESERQEINKRMLVRRSAAAFANGNRAEKIAAGHSQRRPAMQDVADRLHHGGAMVGLPPSGVRKALINALWHRFDIGEIAHFLGVTRKSVRLSAIKMALYSPSPERVHRGILNNISCFNDHPVNPPLVCFHTHYAAIAKHNGWRVWDYVR